MSGARVLVIDDSALMRKHLRSILESGGYEVDTARNGKEGLEKVELFNPQVVSLDINMPVMDGITCLSLIMQNAPRPVVMVSSLTEKGALATFEALELGAVDYVAKPGGTVSINIKDVSADLLEKVGAAAKTRINRGHGLRTRLRVQREAAETAPLKRQRRPSGRAQATNADVVLMGVSTGGPSTIEEIVLGLPADFPVPIVVAQHMPQRFTKVFADRLNKITPLTVKEVSGPTELVAGEVLIAQGDADIKLIRRAGRLMATSIPADPGYVWHPSVERLVESADALLPADRMICVQLTGMGNDGAAKMSELHTRGTRTIAESEETAVVYGMPRELIELGGAEVTLPSYKVADQLISWVM